MRGIVPNVGPDLSGSDTFSGNTIVSESLDTGARFVRNPLRTLLEALFFDKRSLI
jgi:hypothetical protein